MSTSPAAASHNLWQPQKPVAPVVQQRSDRMWRDTSHALTTSAPAHTTPAAAPQLWKKPKPALPVKPESLRAPGLWRSTSYSPDTHKSVKLASSSKRHSRSMSPVSHERQSWIDPILPKYVVRSHHYRNSHSVWAEQMFQQRRQSNIDANWIDSVLPAYVQSGPYRTSHSIWAEQMFRQRRHSNIQASWIDSVLPSYVQSGPYRTSHSIWAENLSQQCNQPSLEASWIDPVLPAYVHSGPYRTSHSVWEEQHRQLNTAASWIDSVLPDYVQQGPYRTSYSVWMETAQKNGADVSWVDGMLPSYVERSRSYRTTHSVWAEKFSKSRPSFTPSHRSYSSPTISQTPTRAASPASAQFPIHQPTSFSHHRNTSNSSDHSVPKSTVKTVACYPPEGLSRTSTMTAGEETTSFNSLLSPPTVKQEAINVFKSPASARFAQLQSPCLFHKRFDDAVNLDRVLEEIEEEEGLSSGRLVQTATSVREINKQLQRKPIKRAVRSVMIVTKARDNSLTYLTRELALWLLSTPRYGSKLGVTVYVDAKLKNSKRFDAAGIVAQNPAFANMLRYWNPDLCWTSPEKFDLVLTLGGDGTVLFTSFSLFQRVVPPVLAFGLGSLGFLTPFKFNEYKNSLDKVMGDQGMRVNLRMRFTCTVFRAPTDTLPRSAKARKALPSPVDTSAMVEGEQFEVLNELVIDRGPSPYVSNLELYADDEMLTVVQADGCIFSTPTGSTAYSLSAGGPLTHPSIPGLVLTPICPHTLSFRPMVLSDALCLKVCIPRDSRSTAYASFDGKHRVELRRGDCVRVEAGRYPFPTVVGDEGTGGEWFGSVRRALRWNTRGAMQKAFTSGDPKKQAQASGARFEDTIEEEQFAKAQVPSNDDEEEDEDDDEVPAAGEEEWDIDFDPIKEEPSTGASVVDSGIGVSESGSHCASPVKRVGIDMMNANNGRGASMEDITGRIAARV